MIVWGTTNLKRWWNHYNRFAYLFIWFISYWEYMGFIKTKLRLKIFIKKQIEFKILSICEGLMIRLRIIAYQFILELENGLKTMAKWLPTIFYI